VKFYDKVQLPAVVFAYHAPAQGTPDAYALEMVAKILSQGKSSRLQKQVVDKQQKAVAAGAFNLPSEDPGLAMMYGIGNMGVTPEDLEKAMDEEVNKILSEGISAEELQKCKNQIENEFISQNQRVLGIVENLANYHVYYGDANLINKELDRYMKVSAADMLTAAKKYLVKTNRLVLYYLPDSSKSN
jgi:predicted Zn-dependent peptidase